MTPIEMIRKILEIVRRGPSNGAGGPREEDRFGAFPKDSDTGDEHRRDSRVIRVLAAGLLGSIALNVVLGSTIHALVPLRRVEPMFLTTSPRSDQVVTVQPLHANTAGIDLMTEVMCKNYVEMRNGIVQDVGVMTRRWGPKGIIARESSSRIYSAFVKEMKPILQDAQQRDITRTIQITADPIKISAGFFQVQFDTVDTKGGRSTRQSWIASMVVHYRPHRVSYSDRFLNPLGFTVTAYSVVRKLS